MKLLAAAAIAFATLKLAAANDCDDAPKIPAPGAALAAAVNAIPFDVEIHGAGATFPAPLYAKWIKAYNELQSQAMVDYQAIGSGGGIKGITDRTIHFAGSDAPMTDAQLKAAPGSLIHIPMVAGPVVMVFNLKDVSELSLDGETIANIYLGKITKWNDPKIAALNPKGPLPDADIVVAHRSDGSGTTWIFTNYLSKVSADWKTQVGNATSVKWPIGLGGKGGDGIAGQIKNIEGSIGYVELAYARSAKIPFATLLNRNGKPVKASIEGVIEAAANSAGQIPADFRASITDAPGDTSYPIAGFTYLLVYDDLSYLNNRKTALQTLHLVQFMLWCASQDQLAPESGYASTPAQIQKLIDAKLKTIRFNGQPLQN